MQPISVMYVVSAVRADARQRSELKRLAARPRPEARTRHTPREPRARLLRAGLSQVRGRRKAHDGQSL